MSDLHEIVKPLLDEGVGPLVYDDGWFCREPDVETFRIEEPFARLMWIGWLVEERGWLNELKQELEAHETTIDMMQDQQIKVCAERDELKARLDREEKRWGVHLIPQKEAEGE